MFTAYLYKSATVEEACNQFIEKNLEENSARDVLNNLTPTEFVTEYLLNKEYLDGEILEEDEHIFIIINNFISSFNIENLNIDVKLRPLQ